MSPAPDAVEEGQAGNTLNLSSDAQATAKSLLGTWKTECMAVSPGAKDTTKTSVRLERIFAQGTVEAKEFTYLDPSCNEQVSVMTVSGSYNIVSQSDLESLSFVDYHMTRSDVQHTIPNQKMADIISRYCGKTYAVGEPFTFEAISACDFPETANTSMSPVRKAIIEPFDFYSSLSLNGDRMQVGTVKTTDPRQDGKSSETRITTLGPETFVREPAISHDTL